jgi:tRNA/tmRNA/rRNA uracil-C5-methylase (TrmA/RlmC/RlmD family)
VRIDTCPVVLPQLDAAIAGLYDAARAPDSRDAFTGAKHAIVRAGAASGQAVLSITTDRQSPEIRNRAPAIARRVRGVVGISNSFEPRTANAVLGRKMQYVWGQREMEETIEGVRYRVSPASFFQVNSEMVGRIFRFLAPGLAPDRTIVDLYCGAGTFAIFFASRGARVVGIEENPAAVREARENAALNKVEDRVRFVEGRVEGAVVHKDGKAALEDAAIVFLDQPGDARARPRVPRETRLRARRRAAVRHVPADRPRRDAGDAAQSRGRARSHAPRARSDPLGRHDPGLALRRQVRQERVPRLRRTVARVVLSHASLSS